MAAVSHSGTRTRQAAVLIRFVREAVNALMPLTQVGGDVIGARLLTFWAIPGPLAAAGVIVDVLDPGSNTHPVCRLRSRHAGRTRGRHDHRKNRAGGFAVAAAVVGGLYLAQRGSARRILHVVLGRLGDGNWRALGTVDAVYRSFSVIYARWPSLLASSALHMAGWLIGVAEVLIGLSYMGQPVSLGEALVIESLIHVVRGAAFAIPSALGAQEAGLIVLCGMFGIPPDEAFALSLMKRAADVVIGIPGLVSLQLLEGKRLRAT